MNKKILWETPNKECAKKDRREYDDESIVICFLSKRIKPVCLEAHDNRMVWIFDYNDVAELHNGMFSGAEISVDYHDVVDAKRKWLDGLFMLRSYIKSNA